MKQRHLVTNYNVGIMSDVIINFFSAFYSNSKVIIYIDACPFHYTQTIDICA